VVPDELDIAADVEQAYAAGGRTRRDLFRSGVVDPGSFGVGIAGVGMVLLLPYVLHALDAAHLAVRGFLHDRSRQTTAHSLVAHELRTSGRPVEETELIAAEVLDELNRDPATAVAFLDFLGRSTR
jgi:hypothetical protein